jgi:hypothetical protein
VIEDAAEGFGSRWKGQVLGTFGDYGVLSFNGNKMITTSGGGALVCKDQESKNKIMWLATQAREAYPYYQHEAIGFNYRLSNICAGIGRGQMTVIDEHLAHHKRIAQRYADAFKDVPGITFHTNPSPDHDSNFWLSTILLDESLHVKGEEKAYHVVIEVRQFDQKTGARISKPRVQKFGKKAYENGIAESLRKQGYDLLILHDPNEWLRAHKEEAAARAKAKAEADAKAEQERFDKAVNEAVNAKLDAAVTAAVAKALADREKAATQDEKEADKGEDQPTDETPAKGRKKAKEQE